MIIQQGIQFGPQKNGPVWIRVARHQLLNDVRMEVLGTARRQQVQQYLSAVLIARHVINRLQ